MAPESATRVGHPAPFPVELPQRLIDLYTYRDDLVLDPFMGSGTTAVAAVRSGRHYIGYDTEEAYVAAARTRVEGEVARLAQEDAGPPSPARRVALPAVPGPADEDEQAQAVREGRKAKELALLVLQDCGFSDIHPEVRYGALGVVCFRARDATGAEWAFDVCGGFTTTRSGLKRADTLWKALGKAAVLHQAHPEVPLVLLTTEAPTPGSAGDAALGVVLGAGKAVHDVVELLNAEDQERLRHHARQGPTPGFCRE
jgi:site-specific DNA-methyltransferase (adenine-specific)